MLRGFLDVVTSSGFVEGWAYDAAVGAGALRVGVCVDGGMVAEGVANGYRADLAEAGCGTGWCAFRLRVSGPVGRLRREASSLVALPGGETLFSAEKLKLVEDVAVTLGRIEDFARNDPTLVGDVGQLRGCGGIFEAVIARSGVEMFVRAAFAYALERPADASGLDVYSRMLITRDLSAFEVVEALCGSAEFGARPRLLAAPTEPGFLFSALLG